MKLLEAFELVNSTRDPQAQAKPFSLVCGFTPLHLHTFLHAYLQRHFREDRVEVKVGLFGTWREISNALPLSVAKRLPLWSSGLTWTRDSG